MAIDLFDPAEILRVLQGFNPWWSGKSPSVPDFKRLAWQSCRRYLSDLSLQRAILLTGLRRVGKTTILAQMAADQIQRGHDPKSILYVSLDHPLLKLTRFDKILALYHQQIYPAGQASLLLLDEVQYADDWELHVKQLVDHHPEYRILATGSASVLQQKNLAESGVGRWIKVPIPTLSFYEFLRVRGEPLPAITETIRPLDCFSMSPGDISELREQCRLIAPSFLRYLLVGGFPETARQTDVGFCQRLLREDVVERVLKRDMTQLFGIRNVGDLEKFFIYLCLNSGGILSVQTCASALGITAPTVNNYLAALEQSHLIYRLKPVHIGGKKVLKAREKIYLADAALRNAVLLRGEEIRHDAAEMGMIVETTILRHLFAYYYQDTPEIAYWRDSSTEKEVDIILKSPGYLLPVEIKYRNQAVLTEKDGIAVYARQENVPWAYWVTQNELDFEVVKLAGGGTQFLRIPAHIFAYLLGQAERLLWHSGS